MAEDTDFSLQDLLRCNLCETHVPSLHYKTYHKQLCEICYEKHLLIESKEVEVGLLPFENSGEPIENSLGTTNFTEYEGDIPRRGFRDIQTYDHPKSSYKAEDAAFHKLKNTELSLPINTVGSMSKIPTKKNLLCEPTYQHRMFAEVISEIEIANKDSKRVRSVFCLNDDNVWICGENNILRLYSPQGKPVKSIKTKSGNRPMDITVTRNGDLVYTDSLDRSVNLVNDTGIKPLITLQGWKPQSVSGSSIGGLLIVMDSDDDNHAKVIHFCESRVKQTIQFDADDFPLYSSGSIKYISENRNLDICVSDCVAGAVVVVNQTGKFRFKYRGIYSKNSCRSFKPFGITTDGEGRILTSDWNNQLIHTLDRDGRLLGYIDCGFVDPYGVCVGNRGNLFVGRYNGGSVMKVRYICLAAMLRRPDAKIRRKNDLG